MFPSRTALILNFTGNTYHWGCFGTAYEIYQTLLERGYAPSFLSVNTTHVVRPAPHGLEDLVSSDFTAQMLKANLFLPTALAETDLVVINGEGTLHGTGPGPRNLLLFASLAKCSFEKPVHLINHSFYPADSRQPLPEVDAFYTAAVRDLDCVVAREVFSQQILLRLGIQAHLGFDSLPRFIMRHCAALQSYPTSRESKAAPLLVSGGASMPEHAARRVAKSVATKRRRGQPILFLTGAKKYPAFEDSLIFEWMSEEVPDMSLVTASSFREWIQVIAEASCLISGRFHHTIAAAMLGTPVVTFPSNTPKMEAIAEMLSFDPPIAYDDLAFEAKIIQGIEQAIAANDDNRTLQRRTKMLALGEENFRNL